MRDVLNCLAGSLALAILSMRGVAAGDQQAQPSASIKVEYEPQNVPFLVKLKITNTTDTKRTIRTNLANVFRCAFFQFPTAGELQFRDASDSVVAGPGANAEGWIFPSTYNSSLNPEGEKRLDALEEVNIPGGGTIDFLLSCKQVLTLARSDLPGGDKAAKGFRIRISFTVSQETEGRRKVVATSGWFPIAW